MGREILPVEPGPSCLRCNNHRGCHVGETSFLLIILSSLRLTLASVPRSRRYTVSR